MDQLPAHKGQIRYQYHHIGIPAAAIRENERYSSTFKMYTSDAANSNFHVQWHRFAEDSPLHPLIKTLPHIAFKVPSIDDAIEGKTVLLGPYFPFEGFRVAMIEDGGIPVEFVETNLTEEEIWSGVNKPSLVYPEKNDASERAA